MGLRWMFTLNSPCSLECSTFVCELFDVCEDTATSPPRTQGKQLLELLEKNKESGNSRYEIQINSQSHRPRV
ncbi:hypothetical protein BaRGS_00022875, partial [Batillaria attramentaria]